MNKLKLSIALLAVSLMGQSANGQTTDTLSDKTVLQNITIRALSNSAKAPFTKTNFTAENIEAINAAVDLPILLQSTSNVVANSDAGAGTGYTGMRLRGSDLTRINVTINGVPVNDAESHTTYFVDIPDLASSAKSITIQRGVGGSSNGPSAFGGSMQINTIDMPEKRGINFNNVYGSFNTFRNTLKINSGRIGKHFFANAKISRISSDGYIKNSASALRGGQLTLAYKPNTNTEIIANYINGYEKTGQSWNGVPQEKLLNDRTYNELGILPDSSYYTKQTDNYGQNYLQLIINKRFNNNWKMNLTPYLTLGKGYYQEYRPGESLNTYGFADYIAGADTFSSVDLYRQLWLDNANAGVLANAVYENTKHTSTIGFNASNYNGKHFGNVLSATYQIPDNYQWYNLESNKQEISAYAKTEYHASNKILLYADAQVRSLVHNINGFRKNPSLIQKNSFTFFNPKFGISYLPTKNKMVYASFAIANKEPNRDDFENSTAPLPEKLYNTELGYNTYHAKGNFKANVYHMAYKNQLILKGAINDVGQYTRTNVPDSYRLGLELEAGIPIKKFMELQGNISFSRNKIKAFYNYTDDYDNGGVQIDTFLNTSIAFSPSIVSAIGINLYPLVNLVHNKNLSILLQNKYVGKQYLDNTQNDTKAISAFNVVDITASYKAAARSKYVATIKLGIQNALNNLYENNGYTYQYIYGGMQQFNYYFPQAGRRYWIGLDIGL